MAMKNVKKKKNKIESQKRDGEGGNNWAIKQMKTHFIQMQFHFLFFSFLSFFSF